MILDTSSCYNYDNKRFAVEICRSLGISEYDQVVDYLKESFDESNPNKVQAVELVERIVAISMCIAKSVQEDAEIMREMNEEVKSEYPKTMCG
jgi:hypothetical protein